MVHTSITGGYRGYKTSLFEGGIRVPGIIEWPAKIKSHTVSDFPVVTSDLLPTLCDLLNISLPKDRVIDGESLLPFILSHNGTRSASMKWAYNIGGDFNSTYSAAISGNKYKVYAEYKKGNVINSYELPFTCMACLGPSKINAGILHPQCTRHVE